MGDIAKKILFDLFAALYQSSISAFVLAVLLMFFYLFTREQGWRKALQKWWHTFRSESIFRRIFLLAFYTALVLCKTLLGRKIWPNPLSNVMGIWWLYRDGRWNAEAFENMLLFLPFMLLLLWSFPEKILGENIRFGKILWQSIKITFLLALLIELLQLFLWLGTFQLSDLFYNTLGGGIGGICYWICHRVKHRK